jgi:pimeloyl-ACP methyl ester carboxylesterase
MTRAGGDVSDGRATTLGSALSADGVPIHYEVHGSGEPVIVFVHGWCCDRTYWRQQIAPFSARSQVVAIDLAGHGESGRGRASWTMRAFGRDVAAVVTRLDLHDVILVGHSMGGDVVVDAALELAGRVRGLVWVDAYDQLDEPRSPGAIDEFLAPFRENFADTMRAFVRKMFPPGAAPDLVEWVSADMAAAPPAVALDAARHAIANGAILPGLLRGVQVPVAALNTGWLRPDVEALARHGVAAVELPEFGHFPMLEAPAAFNAALADLISDVILRG